MNKMESDPTLVFHPANPVRPVQLSTVANGTVRQHARLADHVLRFQFFSEAGLRVRLNESFFQTADWMRNQ